MTEWNEIEWGTSLTQTVLTNSLEMGLWVKVFCSCLGLHRDILSWEGSTLAAVLRKQKQETKPDKTPFCWHRLHSVAFLSGQADGQPQGDLHCAGDEEVFVLELGMAQ